MRVPPSKRSAENHTQFCIRTVQWEAWWRAHDDFCSEYAWVGECKTHRNPYAE